MGLFLLTINISWYATGCYSGPDCQLINDELCDTLYILRASIRPLTRNTVYDM